MHPGAPKFRAPHQSTHLFTLVNCLAGAAAAGFAGAGRALTAGLGAVAAGDAPLAPAWACTVGVQQTGVDGVNLLK